MTTLQSLKADDLLLVGHLVERIKPGDEAPTLALSVFCPFCKVAHTFDWADATGRSTVVDLVALPCPKGISKGESIYVGLDPAHVSSSWNVASLFRRALAKFKPQRETAHV